GLAMQYTKDMFSSMIDSSSHSYCYVWYSWNLFGDPAQQLRIKPEENNPPVISSPIPSPDSDNVSKNITSLSIQMNDADEDLLNWSIETSPDIGSNSGMNEQAGTKSCEIDGLSFDTSYTWYVNVSDGKTEICHLFSFNVESGSMNHAPQLSYPNPLNESINIDVHLSEVSIQINDLESNIFSYTIQGTHVQGITNDNQSNGTKTTTCITPLPFATQIMWYVNASDTMNATYEWFTFTTRDKYIPQSPSDLTSYAVNRSCIHLEWTVDDQTDKTRVERNLFPEWELGSGVLVYNGTDQKIIDNNLSSKETYYYQAWSYNETDNVYSLNSTSGQQTTHLNHPPEITSVTPLNNSENLSVEFTYLANLSDLDADQLQWMITCSHGECNSSKAKNTTASLDLNNLEKNTTYRVWINVTDGYDWTRSWYQFSTHQIHIPPKVTGFSANIVNSTQSQISWDKPAYNPVLLEYHQQPEWDVGNGITLYNGTEKNTITHNGLTRNTTYHYQLWQYNSSDQTYSEPVSTQITTPSNVNPILTGETPQNQSIPSSLPSSWSVMITDSDEDLLNWSITISSKDFLQEKNRTGEPSGLKTVKLTDLRYQQTYTVEVIVHDGFSSVKRSYVFYTNEKPPSSPSSSSSSGGSNGLMPVVPNQPPVAKIEHNVTAVIGETVLLSAKQSSDEETDALQYRWDFTSDTIWDTEWLETPLINTSYNQTGLYTVTVEVTDGTSSDQDTALARILQGNKAPTLSYDCVNESILILSTWNYDVVLNDADGDTCRYKIDYGDNTSLDWSKFHPANSTHHLHHTYKKTGSFQVRLLVEDTNQAQSGWITLGNLTVMPSTDSFFVFPSNEREKITIQIDQQICLNAYQDFINIDDTIKNISWYIDGCLLGTDPTFCYRFTAPGTRILSCVYTTNTGRTYQTDQLLIIESKDELFFFNHSLFFAFGAFLSAGVLSGGWYYLKKKKRYLDKKSDQMTHHEYETQKSTPGKYEHISKQVDEVLKK
ncbi:MAG: hypothetical protein KGY65_07265, partial [Candidatus Thermoplasmatota archaeon]|nr:hypothetical protein [Candidatus Thermoplasmatota archaeon]